MAPVLQIGDELKTNPSKVANVLNDYFASMSSKYIAARQTCLDTKSVIQISHLLTVKLMIKTVIYIPPVTTDLVLQQLKHMPSTKATAWTG